MENAFAALSEHERKVLEAAYLHTQGYSGNVGAGILGCSEPHFAMLLKEARQKGLVSTLLNEELYSEEVWKGIRILASPHTKLEKELKTRAAGHTLRGLRIYYSGQEGTKSEDWSVRLEHHFCPQASRRVLDLLESANYVGIGWGHTVAALTAALEKYPNGAARRSKNPNKVLFIPTCGEPLGPESRPERASSALVARLHALWGCKGKPLSLAGVGSVIQEKFKGAERDTVRRYIADMRDYRLIFGPPAEVGTAPLIQKVDCLISSVGSFAGDWQKYQDELIRVGGIDREELRELALGDIGGALIPQSGLSRSQKERLRSITESWTGITLEQCKRIASKADNSGKPGVIVLAIGKNKANVVLEIVKQRLVNELIIDHDLAGELGNKLKIDQTA